MKDLFQLVHRPALFERSKVKFWNDPHIAKGMLEAHLNPGWDAATRNHEFVARSAAWIAALSPPREFPNLLDLGCGPGIYAEKFHEASYRVTGVDFSERSIEYARRSAAEKNYNIRYMVQDYLELSLDEAYDVITLIYCDFGVLSAEERKRLLRTVFEALKPGGTFVFDVFTPAYHAGKPESKSWDYYQTGFFCEQPHVRLDSFYRYDEDNTVLSQNIVITDEAVHCYNIWEHTFTAEELKAVLAEAGFSTVDFYGDAAGAPYERDGSVICAAATKQNK